jgi:glycosyltransferase involved in cell wall biosynthesis
LSGNRRSHRLGFAAQCVEIKTDLLMALSESGKNSPDPQTVPPKVAVVIPSYKVSRHIIGVVDGIGPECHAIYVIDDGCPEKSGKLIAENINSDRVTVLYNETNQGVGGAVMTGYRQAMADGADIIVKVDGDGQMNPALINKLIGPIISGVADYCKGNRFYNPSDLREMPKIRLVGNALLSFMTKVSSGYWNSFDPTNGFTAIHAKVAEQLPMEKIAKRYFFESDMLFHLNVMRAVVSDFPMSAKYGDEVSNLKIMNVIGEFLCRNISNTFKRIIYSYFLRNFSVASIEVVLGPLLILFGAVFGGYQWWLSSSTGVTATTGSVMIAALPIIVGMQLFLSFLNFDILNEPREPLHPRL